MRRREVVRIVPAAAAVLAWPAGTLAQSSAMPLVGYLGSNTLAASLGLVEAFKAGLTEQGFVDGQNVTLEYRWAQSHPERLRSMAAELAQGKVSVILAGGPPAALAAKSASTDIPVVFTSGEDPVKLGLVSSLARPQGHVTGVSLLFAEVEAKRLELLRELVPGARTIGLLHAPGESDRDFARAADQLGLQMHAVAIDKESQLDAAFESFSRRKVDAIIGGSGPQFSQWRVRTIQLAARARLPAVYETLPYVRDGGLMSYAASTADAYRQAGVYVGRILKGEKPGDLPVVRPTRLHLAINLKTAKALGIAVPRSLLLRADEVIN